MSAPHEPAFSRSEEKPVVAYLLAAPQLLHGRFHPTYERILGGLLSADPSKLSAGELEALGDKGKIFFGEGFVPVKSRNKKKRRGRQDASRGEGGDSGRGESSKADAGVNGEEAAEDESGQGGQGGNGASGPIRKLDRDLSIYVRGIDDTMTAEGLKDAFDAYGVVNAVDVVYDRHCAYIEFTTKESCDRAIEAREIPIGEAKVLAFQRRIFSGPRGYGRGGRGGYSQRGGYNDYSYRGGYRGRGYRGGRGFRGGNFGATRTRSEEYGNGETAEAAPVNTQEEATE